MMRLSTALWLVLIAVVGFAMFQVKYEVQALEENLAAAKRRIAQNEEAIHVLKAEWSFLNQPARLEQLSRRHLTLAPVGAAQLGRIEDIPERPPQEPAMAATPAPTPAPAPVAPAPRAPNGGAVAKAPQAPRTAIANRVP